MGCGFESCCRHSFFHSNRSFNAKFRSNSVQKSRIVQFGTLWHSKAVHGLNLQASAANLHIVKILRDIEGSFYNSYGIQGLEMTFWALYFHTPICHSAMVLSYHTYQRLQTRSSYTGRKSISSSTLSISVLQNT